MAAIKQSSVELRLHVSVIRRKYRARQNKLGCFHASVIAIRCPSPAVPESLHVAIQSVETQLTDAYTKKTLENA